MQADKALDVHTQRLHQLNERKEAEEQNASLLASDLTTLLARLIPDWQQDTAGTRQQLALATHEYNNRKKELDAVVNEWAAASMELDELKNQTN